MIIEGRNSQIYQLQWYTHTKKKTEKRRVYSTSIYGTQAAQYYGWPKAELQWGKHKYIYGTNYKDFVCVSIYSKIVLKVESFCLLIHWLSEARKSSNKPEARKVLDNLIYNYNPTYSGKTG